VDLFVVGDLRGMVAPDSVGSLGERLVKVHLHRVAHDVAGPEAGVGGGEEVGDLLAVRVPPRLCVFEAGGVTRLGGEDDLDRGVDVFAE